MTKTSLKEKMKIGSVADEALVYTPLETKPVGASSYDSTDDINLHMPSKVPRKSTVVNNTNSK